MSAGSATMASIACSSNTIYIIGETTTNIQHTVTMSLAYGEFWRDLDDTHSLFRSSSLTGDKFKALSRPSSALVTWAKNCRRMPKNWTFLTLTFQGWRRILSVNLTVSRLRSELNSLICQQNRWRIFCPCLVVSRIRCLKQGQCHECHQYANWIWISRKRLTPDQWLCATIQWHLNTCQN